MPPVAVASSARDSPPSGPVCAHRACSGIGVAVPCARRCPGSIVGGSGRRGGRGGAGAGERGWEALPSQRLASTMQGVGLQHASRPKPRSALAACGPPSSAPLGPAHGGKPAPNPPRDVEDMQMRQARTARPWLEWVQRFRYAGEGGRWRVSGAGVVKVGDQQLADTWRHGQANSPRRPVGHRCDTCADAGVGKTNCRRAGTGDPPIPPPRPAAPASERTRGRTVDACTSRRGVPSLAIEDTNPGCASRLGSRLQRNSCCSSRTARRWTITDRRRWR